MVLCYDPKIHETRIIYHTRIIFLKNARIFTYSILSYTYPRTLIRDHQDRVSMQSCICKTDSFWWCITTAWSQFLMQILSTFLQVSCRTITDTLDKHVVTMQTQNRYNKCLKNKAITSPISVPGNSGISTGKFYVHVVVSLHHHTDLS